MMQYVALALLCVAIATGRTVNFGSVYMPNGLFTWLAVVALTVHVAFDI